MGDAPFLVGPEPGPPLPPGDLVTTLAPIAAQLTAMGREVHKLWIVDGWLYPAYGDFETNTGPLELLRVNLTDLTVEDVGTVHTEETWNLRWDGDGDALLPYVDPRGGYTATQHYASMTGGVWTLDELLMPASTSATPEHLMSACMNAAGDWVGGAAYGSDPGLGGAATIWHRPTGGSWAVSLQLDNGAGSDATGFARFYLLMTFGDDILASLTDGQSSRAFHWNGATWTEVTTRGALSDGSPFNLSGTPYWLCREHQLDVGQVSDKPLIAVALDPAVQTAITAALPTGNFRAISATPGALHAWLLRNDGHLFRGDTDGTFHDVHTVTSMALVRSLAVDEATNTAYLGGNAGELWTVALP